MVVLFVAWWPPFLHSWLWLLGSLVTWTEQRSCLLKPFCSQTFLKTTDGFQLPLHAEWKSFRGLHFRRIWKLSTSLKWRSAMLPKTLMKMPPTQGVKQPQLLSLAMFQSKSAPSHSDLNSLQTLSQQPTTSPGQSGVQLLSWHYQYTASRTDR